VVARGGEPRLLDVATLTGAIRSALGDQYIGVFANDDSWRGEVVAAGDAAGTTRGRCRSIRATGVSSRRSQTSGTRPGVAGYPIFAAAFLERFVDRLP
jgi:leucyl aminopeptidase